MSNYNPDLVKEEPLDEVPESAPERVQPMNEENRENQGVQEDNDVKPYDLDTVLAQMGDVHRNEEAAANLWRLTGEGVMDVTMVTPKKPKWQCPFCTASSCFDSGKCNGCNMWVHTKCAGYRSYKQFPTDFKCANCRH